MFVAAVVVCCLRCSFVVVVCGGFSLFDVACSCLLFAVVRCRWMCVASCLFVRCCRLVLVLLRANERGSLLYVVCLLSMFVAVCCCRLLFVVDVCLFAVVVCCLLLLVVVRCWCCCSLSSVVCCCCCALLYAAVCC